MSYETWDDDIAELRAKAKRKLGVSDRELGKLLNVSESLLRNRNCEKRLPDLRFWTVVQMAKAAGKEIVIR